MTWMFIRRSITCYHFQTMKRSLSLSILRAIHGRAEPACNSPLGSSNESTSTCYSRSPLMSRTGDHLSDYKIDIVDYETWRVSTGFAGVRKDVTIPIQLPSSDKAVNRDPRNLDDPDIDEIDDLRICGNLFYKLDRGSKEYEEHKFDFHRKKSSKSKTKQGQNEDKINEIKTKRIHDERMNKTEKSLIGKKQRVPTFNQLTGNEIKTKRIHDERMNKTEKSLIGKKQRVPTFNQLTGPYHEPFCLDVYISKASVRACIVHRATSKVVVVAHSISKDMKFDLGSTRNAAACVAVGKVLAQRALADDIHNVVYTPRKGEKLEGKLQNVVESLINNGLWVKIKLKKTKVRKPGFQSVNYKLSYPSRR